MILRVQFLIEGKIRYSLNLENLSYFSKIRWNGPAHIYIYIITSIHNKIFKQYNSRSTTIQKTLCQAISKIQTKWYKNSNLSFHPIIEKTVWKFLGRLIPIIVEILFIRVQSFFIHIALSECSFFEYCSIVGDEYNSKVFCSKSISKMFIYTAYFRKIYK